MVASVLWWGAITSKAGIIVPRAIPKAILIRVKGRKIGTETPMTMASKPRKIRLKTARISLGDRRREARSSSLGDRWESPAVVRNRATRITNAP